LTVQQLGENVEEDVRPASPLDEGPGGDRAIDEAGEEDANGGGEAGEEPEPGVPVLTLGALAEVVRTMATATTAFMDTTRMEQEARLARPRNPRGPCLRGLPVNVSAFHPGSKEGLHEWTQNATTYFQLRRTPYEEQVMLLSGPLLTGAAKLRVQNFLRTPTMTAHKAAGRHEDIVHAIFAELRRTYAPLDPVRDGLQELAQVKQGVSETALSYHGKMLKHLDTLARHGEELSNAVQLSMFLQGLQENPRRFLNVHKKPTTLARACRELTQWEKHNGPGNGRPQVDAAIKKMMATHNAEIAAQNAEIKTLLSDLQLMASGADGAHD